MQRLILFVFALITGWVFSAQAHTYAENRLVEVGLTNGNGTELQTYSYDLSPTGMRTNVFESAGASIVRQIRYGYDSINPLHPKPRVNRLTEEDYYNYENVWQGEIEYGYDAAGNRTGRTVDIWEFTPYDSLTNQSFAFDHRDLIDSDNVPNNANPNYDANGNTLVDNGTNTGDLYDAENRLISTGSDVTLTYDADGNRVSKTKWGETTYYLVDDLNPTGYSQVLAEYASLSSAPNTTYQWGLGLISQQPIDDNRVYYGYDGQGNVRMLLDNTGLANTIATYDYDGYGDLLASSDPGYYGNNYRYCGYEWDGDLGMYYNRARYYKPSLGRFWTMDTDEGDQDDPLTIHKYLYCYANPINNDDPTGNGPEFNDKTGTLAHEQFYLYCVSQGIPKYFDTMIGIAVPQLAEDANAEMAPDVIDLSAGRKRWFELKPISRQPGSTWWFDTAIQLSNYRKTLRKAGIRPGNSHDLVPVDNTPIGPILDPDTMQHRMVYLNHSEIPGLVYYYFGPASDEDVLDFVLYAPLIPTISLELNSSAVATRLVSGYASSMARGAVAAGITEGETVGASAVLP